MSSRLRPPCRYASGERGGQVPLQGLQFWFEGACAAVELALVDEAREVWAQVRLGKPVEVSLAAESRLLGEDGERQDFGVR